METPNQKWMRTGGTLISGELQITSFRSPLPHRIRSASSFESSWNWLRRRAWVTGRNSRGQWFIYIYNYIYIWDRGNNRAPLQSFNSSRLCLRTSQQMKCLYLIASLDEFLGLGNHLGTISAVRIDFLKAVQARQSFVQIGPTCLDSLRRRRR